MLVFLSGPWEGFVQRSPVTYALFIHFTLILLWLYHWCFKSRIILCHIATQKFGIIYSLVIILRCNRNCCSAPKTGIRKCAVGLSLTSAIWFWQNPSQYSVTYCFPSPSGKRKLNLAEIWIKEKKNPFCSLEVLNDYKTKISKTFDSKVESVYFILLLYLVV